ncbi:sugar ABC transporter permease [Paenibacillus sp. GP183]|uniref:carbohydrate ABC transporter permease n=1 Tax=Paenibacillus sp. GP183 TaxID=1882751 RepID=UPI00089582A8|nr:sugar ABC transporter permease [Paenibacillus sp. GP183]SEB71407.1 multiple sugar transport system permease protein [Paenibacillus sp. GP183]
MDLQLTTPITKSASRRKIRWYFWGLLFLIPEIVIFLIFLWIPIYKGIAYSFYSVDFVSGNTFVGLQNYIEVLSNPDFYTAIKNTLLFMGLALLLGFWVPIAMAIAVSELKWFKGPARIVGYLPSIIPAIVLYGMWQWFYDAVGPINSFLNTLGIAGIDFYSKANAMFSLIILETWQNFGSTTLIYIAGLSTIPKDLYEAAEIDGASVWNRIRYVTLPGIKNLILLLLVLQLIATSQSFQSQLLMFGGGPDNATLTYLLLTTREAFVFFNFGKASAMGTIMFVVLVIFSILTIRIRRGGEEA